MLCRGSLSNAWFSGRERSSSSICILPGSLSAFNEGPCTALACWSEATAARISWVTKFNLQSRVLDAKFLMQLVGNLCQQRVVASCLGHHHVRGQCRLGSAHAPDVQVMHVDTRRQSRQIFLHVVHVYSGRHRIKREVERVTQQPPGAINNQRHNNQTDYRIKP